MLRRWIITACLLAISPAVLALEAAPGRFATLAVCVDSGAESLAAWQIALTPVNGEAEIVGIEGGAAPFDEPPFYDTAALRAGKVVLAAFSTKANPNRGAQRVATVHVLESGAEATEYTLSLVAAGNEAGVRIAARVWASQNDCKRKEEP